MKRLFLVLGTAVLVLPWLAGAKSQADEIHWSASGSIVPGSEGAFVPAIANYPYSSAGIQVFPGQYNGPASGTNSGSVTVVNLGTYLNGIYGDSYQFGASTSQYQLALHLTDQASGASGTLTFGGYLSGTLPVSYGIALYSLTNTFVGPTTQSLKLGQNLYTVTIGPVVHPQEFIAPDDFPSNDSGSISASISVQPLTNSAPEPSSLLLACLSLPPLGLARWLRRRKVVDSGSSNA